MGATMGKGGHASIYDPKKKKEEGYWKAVQEDLNKYTSAKGKNVKPKKQGA